MDECDLRLPADSDTPDNGAGCRSGGVRETPGRIRRQTPSRLPNPSGKLLAFGADRTVDPDEETVCDNGCSASQGVGQ